MYEYYYWINKMYNIGSEISINIQIGEIMEK